MFRRTIIVALQGSSCELGRINGFRRKSCRSDIVVQASNWLTTHCWNRNQGPGDEFERFAGFNLELCGTDHVRQISSRLTIFKLRSWRTSLAVEVSEWLIDDELAVWKGFIGEPTIQLDHQNGSLRPLRLSRDPACQLRHCLSLFRLSSRCSWRHTVRSLRHQTTSAISKSSGRAQT